MPRDGGIPSNGQIRPGARFCVRAREGPFEDGVIEDKHELNAFP